MFDSRKKIESKQLDSAINRVLDEMDAYGPDSPEYAIHLGHLQKLSELKTNRRKSIDANTLVLAGANILGIIIIVSYEHAHVMVSKAFGLVGKTK